MGTYESANTATNSTAVTQLVGSIPSRERELVAGAVDTVRRASDLLPRVQSCQKRICVHFETNRISVSATHGSEKTRLLTASDAEEEGNVKE
jgi:hypothetical protein